MKNIYLSKEFEPKHKEEADIKNDLLLRKNKGSLDYKSWSCFRNNLPMAQIKAKDLHLTWFDEEKGWFSGDKKIFWSYEGEGGLVYKFVQEI